jgi:hypothetical protein
LLAGCLAATVAGAQLVGNEHLDDANIPPRDYFGRASDPETAQLIRMTERYHLTEDTFWTMFRKPDYRAARGELIFILRYIPNHPECLHLLGIVSNLMGEPAYPIYFYERAVRLFPARAYTRAQYGRYLVSIGHREAGLVELRAAHLADGTDPMVLAWLREAETNESIPPPTVPR